MLYISTTRSKQTNIRDTLRKLWRCLHADNEEDEEYCGEATGQLLHREDVVDGHARTGAGRGWRLFRRRERGPALTTEERLELVEQLVNVVLRAVPDSVSY